MKNLPVLNDALDFNEWLNCVSDVKIILAANTSALACPSVLQAVQATIKPGPLAAHSSKCATLEGIIAQVRMSLDIAHAYIRAFISRTTSFPKPKYAKTQNANSIQVTSYIEAFYKRDFVKDIPENLYQFILEKSLTSTSREQYATHESGALSLRFDHLLARPRPRPISSHLATIMDTVCAQETQDVDAFAISPNAQRAD